MTKTQDAQGETRKLTKRLIDALKRDPEGPATQIVYDAGTVSGFGVRLYPTGRKAFVVWDPAPDRS